MIKTDDQARLRRLLISHWVSAQSRASTSRTSRRITQTEMSKPFCISTMLPMLSRDGYTFIAKTMVATRNSICPIKPITK